MFVPVQATYCFFYLYQKMANVYKVLLAKSKKLWNVRVEIIVSVRSGINNEVNAMLIGIRVWVRFLSFDNVVTSHTPDWLGYCVWHSDIFIRRQGIQIVSFYCLLVAPSARYWSAHHTWQTRFFNVPVYRTETRDHSSWEEPVYISI